MTVVKKSMKVHKEEYEILKKIRKLKNNTELLNLKQQLKSIRSRESYSAESNDGGEIIY
jgi:hypothetical protein